MPEGSLAQLGNTLQAPKENTLPTVGQKVLLNWAKWGNMVEVQEGSPMSPRATYVEVEVKAIKTAKVILE
jgi:hypothetical protein